MDTDSPLHLFVLSYNCSLEEAKSQLIEVNFETVSSSVKILDTTEAICVDFATFLSLIRLNTLIATLNCDRVTPFSFLFYYKDIAIGLFVGDSILPTFTNISLN